MHCFSRYGNYKLGLLLSKKQIGSSSALVVHFLYYIYMCVYINKLDQSVGNVWKVKEFNSRVQVSANS